VEQNGYYLDIVHPNGAVLHLKVLLPSDRCKQRSFLGVTLYAEPKPEGPEPSFYMSGSTGNIREIDGRKLGDAPVCMYPRMTPGRRSLEWSAPRPIV